MPSKNGYSDLIPEALEEVRTERPTSGATSLMAGRMTARNVGQGGRNIHALFRIRPPELSTPFAVNTISCVRIQSPVQQ